MARTTAVDSSFDRLDATKVHKTLEQVIGRIALAFPDSGLHRVGQKLSAIAKESEIAAGRLARRNHLIALPSRLLVVLSIILMLVVGVCTFFNWDTRLNVTDKLEHSLILPLGVVSVLVFLWRLESDWKRSRALGDLHKLRCIIHVIDMHQLAKDPRSAAVITDNNNPGQERKMSADELVSYLDWSTDLLSLTGKIAALYAQNSHEPSILQAAHDLGQIAANMSSKIWQKIAIISAEVARTAESGPARPVQRRTLAAQRVIRPA
jgi:hypothetical protein